MVIIWGTFITSWEKVIISWGKLITFGVNYHYRLASVQDLKSTKKILAGVRPPPAPPFWQCQDFESAYYSNRSLITQFDFLTQFSRN